MQLFGIDLCKYKDALGKAGSDEYTRIFTVRVMDVFSINFLFFWYQFLENNIDNFCERNCCPSCVLCAICR